MSEDIAQRRDDSVDAVPLWTFPLDWRGLYTRRYTYAFDTFGGHPTRYRQVFFSRPEGLTWNSLYDRESDPWELRNRFASATDENLQTRLHEQTLALMKRFGDEGWSYRHIQSKIFSEEDFQIAQDVSGVRRTSGLLRGCPLDLL